MSVPKMKHKDTCDPVVYVSALVMACFFMARNRRRSANSIYIEHFFKEIKGKKEKLAIIKRAKRRRKRKIFVTEAGIHRFFFRR